MQATYSDLVFHESRAGAVDNHLVGVLKGEGVGSEVVDAALCCLDAVGEAAGLEFSVVFGGEIGKAAEMKHGSALSEEVTRFCLVYPVVNPVTFSGRASIRIQGAFAKH